MGIRWSRLRRPCGMRARPRWARVALALGMAATTSTLVVAGTAPLAAAAVVPDATPATGWARFGHFAPTKGAVDLYLDGNKVVNNVSFKQVTPYVALTPGPHKFELRDAGSAPTAPAIAVSVSITAGMAETVAGVSTHDGITAEIYIDDLTSPPAGQARIRVIHTLPDVQSVDVAISGGATLFSALPFPQASSYTDIAAGTYTLVVRQAGTTTPLLAIQGFKAQAGSVQSVVIVRGQTSLDAVALTDAVGTQTPPTQGLPTGEGGTAGRGGWPVGWTAGAGVGLLALGGFAGRRRRRLRQAPAAT